MEAVLKTDPSRGTAASEWLPVAAGLLALYVPTFYRLATTLWQTDDEAHGPIVLAVIVWLAWQKRKSLLSACSRTAPVAGFTLVVVGLLFYVLGRSQSIVVLELGALIPILAGVLLAMRGWRGMRAFWFPLLFIVFLIPLPGVFVDALTGTLKQAVSVAAEELLYAAGYPIARNGVALTIGQYHLMVADACAGLKSMFSLSALGLFYLYLVHGKSWLRNGVLLASILPIALAANIVRVIVLVLVTYYFGDAAGQGVVHGLAGMMLFVIGLLILFGLDSLLASLAKVAAQVKARYLGARVL